jgi:DNA repair protein RecO (recombination protein O)
VPLHRTEALVLRTASIGESDRIVWFLTRDRGKKRGVAKGALRSRRRFAGALEPLTYGRVAYAERDARELVRLEFVEPLVSPLALADPEALGHVGYFAELIDEWAPEGQPDERLFRLGVSTVRALAAGAPVAPLARYFEYWLLRLQGVYPPLAACPACGGSLAAGAAVLPRDRVLVCRDCAGAALPAAAALSAHAVAFLREAARLAPEALGRAAPPPEALRELELAHRRLLAFHLEREPRSARVLEGLR